MYNKLRIFSVAFVLILFLLIINMPIILTEMTICNTWPGKGIPIFHKRCVCDGDIIHLRNSAEDSIYSGGFTEYCYGRIMQESVVYSPRGGSDAIEMKSLEDALVKCSELAADFGTLSGDFDVKVCEANAYAAFSRWSERCLPFKFDCSYG